MGGQEVKQTCWMSFAKDEEDGMEKGKEKKRKRCEISDCSSRSSTYLI
jgi:hypothetical protein